MRAAAGSLLEIVMNLEQQKERALTFLKNFEKPEAKAYEDLITDDFEFEMMGRLPGVAPVRGKDAFLKSTPPMLKAMFPNGLNMKFHSTIAEGPQVAIQAESDTTPGHGKKYPNPYHFHFLFNSHNIPPLHEY